jgi:hypothetical protein
VNLPNSDCASCCEAPQRLASLRQWNPTSRQVRDSDARHPEAAVFSARWRPVEVPDDLDDSAPRTGHVRLPVEIAWSGQPDYGLADRQQLCRVYEQVLREGTAEEVRRYVRASTLLEVWDELYLPMYVRMAWEPWVAAHRGDRDCR